MRKAGQKFYAHSLPSRPEEEWQGLEEHLCNVAKRAKEFVKSFNPSFDNSDWVELAGLWHDLGKYLPEWQRYLSGEKRKGPNHSTVGAVLAFECLKQHPVARILGSLIAGHHAGLPDWYPDDAGGDLPSRIYVTSDGILNSKELDEIRDIAEVKEVAGSPLPKSAPFGIKSLKNSPRIVEHFHLWIRMLFSCLVDADFLDTEKFMQSEKTSQRGEYPLLKELSDQFDKFMRRKQASSDPSEINACRNQILEQSRFKAKLPSGFFSLTVPTGGGKTLSAMAFALQHAIKHDKKRIIMAIPYTSIIEQTAKVYKYGSDDDEEIKKAIETGECLFGADAVIEHHSNIDPDEENSKSRLASENWDAPVIVTTNVQLFESLLASRTSACRKLHNIANSVIILDEAQMLPPEYLKPILSVLKGLVEHFGVTVVLCTATQPALCGKIGSEQAVFDGLLHVTEIMDNPAVLTNAFKRVEIDLPDLSVRTEWPELAEKLKGYWQVLCVVNTRRDCRDLHALMPDGTFHLSANMCGEERSEVIGKIKKKLKSGEEIRVISTQLIEAGVDIDFPVVYRALAGVDSIAQSAGRCNRETKQNAQGKLGKVVVFQPPKPAPRGFLLKGENSTKAIFQSGQSFDFTPSLYSKYFRQFYSALNDFDKPKFWERLVKEADEFKFQFRTFAQNVRLIDDTVQRGIIIYYQGENAGSASLIGQLRKNGPERWLIRKLQRFIVNVPIYLFDKLAGEGHIEEIHGYWVQKNTGLYRPGYGLLSEIHNWDDGLYIQ